MQNKTQFNQTGQNFFLGRAVKKHDNIIIRQGKKLSAAFLDNRFKSLNQRLALHRAHIAVFQPSGFQIKRSVVVKALFHLPQIIKNNRIFFNHRLIGIFVK